jgi:hypothetical protein
MSLARFLLLIGLLPVSLISLAQAQASSIEVDFTTPSGYVVKHDGDLLWIIPQAPNNARTPCTYGLAAARPSKGSLEVDAEAALAEATAGGWQRINDRRIARRGVSAAGWHYFLLGGEFAGALQGQILNLAVMAMVFPAPANRVNVLIGLGNIARCTFEDVPFAQLFLSLRPHGWPNPPPDALEGDLIGTWGGSGLSRHTFYPKGRYSRSAGGILHGEATWTEGDGTYVVRGSEITITERAGSERFRVYIYDKWNNFRWQRAMTVLYEAKGPSVAEYVREGIR